MYGSVAEGDNSVSVPGSGPHSLLSLVRSNRAGLSRLREDHLHILDTIRNSDSNGISRNCTIFSLFFLLKQAFKIGTQR